MGYRIRMAAEVAEWLAQLRISDPATADLVDQALAALRSQGADLGPPLVVPVPPDQPVRPDLHQADRRLLATLTRLRQAVAQVTTARKRLDLQIRQLDQQAEQYRHQGARAREMGRDDLAGEVGKRLAAITAQLSELRDQDDRFRSAEGSLTIAARRLQDAIDDFRTSAGTHRADAAATAAEVAADAEAAARDALAATGGTWSEPASQPDTVSKPGTSRPGADGAPAPLPLSQLRLGGPGRSSVCILFTVEPAAAIAVLLAAGTERDWLDAWYTDAIRRSRDRYERDQGHPG